MKKYYDKVLFLLALAVLGLGAGIFFKGGLPKSTTVPAPKLTGAAFSVIEKPKFEQASQTWGSAPDQRAEAGDPGWTYAVFTPPLIWWVPGEGFKAVPPEPVPPVPFGVHLVSAKKELYRIQLRGPSGAGDSDDIMIFNDEEMGMSFHLKADKEGQVDADNEKTAKLHAVRLKDLTYKQVDKGHGLVLKLAIATVLDTRSNETITLTQGEEYAPNDNQLYVLKTEDPFPAQEWKVSKTNHDEILEFPGQLEDFKDTITFKVVALDFAKPSVTVEKHFTTKNGNRVTQSRELLLNDNNSPASDQAKTAPAPAAAH